MPWKERSVMDERLQFVARRLAGEQRLKAVFPPLVKALPLMGLIARLPH
jgi:hypothetical protein